MKKNSEYLTTVISAEILYIDPFAVENHSVMFLRSVKIILIDCQNFRRKYHMIKYI